MWVCVCTTWCIAQGSLRLSVPLTPNPQVIGGCEPLDANPQVQPSLQLLFFIKRMKGGSVGPGLNLLGLILKCCEVQERN